MESEKNFNNMAIVIVSYDGYSDLWNDFFQLLEVNWPDNPFNVYLINNEMQPTIDNVKIVNTAKNAEWSTRARMGLEKIEEKYICLLLEDFYIGSKINTHQVIETLKFIESKKVNYYKLNSFSNIRSRKFENKSHIQKIPSTLHYGISLQAAIWNKEFLLDKIGGGSYNAWQFEIDRIEEVPSNQDKYLENCFYDNRNILNICHVVVQGKVLPSAVKYFKRKGMSLHSNREVMKKIDYYFYKSKFFGVNYFPLKFRKTLKYFMVKFGADFVTKK